MRTFKRSERRRQTTTRQGAVTGLVRDLLILGMILLAARLSVKVLGDSLWTAALVLFLSIVLLVRINKNARRLEKARIEKARASINLATGTSGTKETTTWRRWLAAATRIWWRGPLWVKASATLLLLGSSYTVFLCYNAHRGTPIALPASALVAIGMLMLYLSFVWMLVETFIPMELACQLKPDDGRLAQDLQIVGGDLIQYWMDVLAAEKRGV